jgi:photosystem II stability/assembly factor-like uncharacterized protein
MINAINEIQNGFSILMHLSIETIIYRRNQAVTLFKYLAMTRKILPVLFSFLLQVHISSAQWIATNGPGGGEVNAMAVQGARIFVAMNARESLFMSEDSGRTWQRSSTGIPSGPCKMVFSRNGILYASTNGSLYSSSDVGSTWNQLTGWNSNYLIDAAANDSGIFVATELGIFYSRNNGQTWINTNWREEPKRIFAMGSLLFVTRGMQESDSLFESLDQGTSWNFVTITDPVHCMIKAGNFLFAGTEGGRVIRSADNGSSWSGFSSGISDPWIFALWTNGTKIFSGSSYGRVFSSSNNGITWQMIGQNVPGSEIRALSGFGETLLAGTYGGVYLMVPFASDWIYSSDGIACSSVQSMTCIGNIIVAGTLYNDVFTSHDNGISWIHSSSGLQGKGVRALYCMANKLFSASESGGIYESSDSGGTWSLIAQSGNSFYAITANSSTIFAGGDSYIYKSSDLGQTWSLSGYSGPYIITLSTIGDTIFAGTGSGVYLSIDNGNSWSFKGLQGRLVRGIIFSEGKLFGAADGFVFCSNDLGNTWSLNLSGNDYISMCKQGNILFACAETGIAYSSDNGSSWHGCGNGPFVWDKLIFTTSTTAFIGSWGSGIWKRDLTQFIPLSDNSLLVSLDLNVAPNPSNGEFMIDYSGYSDCFNEINIYNPVGEKIYSEAISHKTGEFHKVVNFSEYSKGIYLLELKGNKRKEIKRIVVE